MALDQVILCYFLLIPFSSPRRLSLYILPVVALPDNSKICTLFVQLNPAEIVSQMAKNIFRGQTVFHNLFIFNIT